MGGGAKITDPTGTINLSVWDSHIQQIEEEKFYTVTNCKLKQYFAKRLAATVNTTVTKTQEQDISHVKPGLEISTRKLAKCEWFFEVASLKNIL